MKKTIDQVRAGYGLKIVNEIIDESSQSDRALKKFSTLINKLPVMIIQNGLGQVLVYMLTENDRGENITSGQILYQKLQDWLCGDWAEEFPARTHTRGDLITQIMSNGRQEYLLAQEEAILVLNWIKKFSNAKMPD